MRIFKKEKRTKQSHMQTKAKNYFCISYALFYTYTGHKFTRVKRMWC